jgi:ribosome-associated protein
MADMSRTDRDTVVEIAGMLDEHLGEDTVVLHVGNLCSWTDYFVITTARSETHQHSLLQRLHGYLRTRDIPTRRSLKNVPEGGWVLVDCGSFVIHVMDHERRAFYELEKLWFNSETIYQSSGWS